MAGTCESYNISAAGSLEMIPPVAKSETTSICYANLRKECLEAIKHWPGCETIRGIQLIRESNGHFTVRITLYGTANEKIANRAARTVQREMRRRFRLAD